MQSGYNFKQKENHFTGKNPLNLRGSINSQDMLDFYKGQGSIKSESDINVKYII